jgi:endoribonuclease LACTB2
LLSDQGPLSAWADASLSDHREALLGEQVTFGHLLAEQGLALDLDALAPIGRWTTPEWVEIRFETEFFLATLTPEQAAAVEADALGLHVQSSELMDATWVTCAEALEAHRTAHALLSVPTIAILKHLQREFDRGAIARPERIDQRDLDDPLAHTATVGAIHMVPLESPTLPPATHTNCYIVGRERFVVIDPGTEQAEQLDKLYSLIDALIERGGTFAAIIITHHHVDHVCGVPALRERYGMIPVWGHALNEGLIDEPIGALDRHLTDDEVIEIDEGHALRCLFTPGHAPGHLVLLHQASHTLLCGDLVASRGTIIVRPPRGHMGDYMQSLRRARALGARALQPAHGWLIPEAQRHLTHYLEHRQSREDAIEEALRAAGSMWCEPMDLVPEVYEDVPEAIWPMAAMSLSAHLIHLLELGCAERRGEDLAFRHLHAASPSGDKTEPS